MAPNAAPYAAARVVTDPADCFFYHSMDIPGCGEVVGQWDLRPNVDAYLGGVDLRGKHPGSRHRQRLPLPAHGKAGAEVVACDLSEQHSWDVVPFADHQPDGQSRNLIRRLNNAYWLAHHANKSRAKVVYTPAYAIPEAIGQVDVATFCSVLLHLRDPFAALAAGSRLTHNLVIVTDMLEAPHIPAPLTSIPKLHSPDIERPLFRRIVNRLRRMLVWPLGVNAGTFGFEPEQIERLVQYAQEKSARRDRPR